MGRASYKAKLVARCIDCGRPRKGRLRRCSKCQSAIQSKAMRASWRNRKITKPPPIRETGPYQKVTETDLRALMDEADAASRKAIAAMEAIKLKT